MQVRDTASGNGTRGADTSRADPPPPPPPPRAASERGRHTTGEHPRADLSLPSSYASGLRSGDGLRLEPPTGTPRRRLPELMLGIFLVAGCALAAVLLAAAGRERTPALALARPIERGQVVTAADLQTVYIGSDSDLAYVSPKQTDQIVDRAALSGLPAGALVTPDQFSDPALLLQSGDATIGLALEAGQLPTLHLAPGDSVVVVAGGGAAGASDEPEVVANGATVESVTQIEDSSGQQSRWWVSLRLTESDATSLAMANASNARVQLVMVER